LTSSKISLRSEEGRVYADLLLPRGSRETIIDKPPILVHQAQVRVEESNELATRKNSNVNKYNVIIETQ